MKIGNIEFGPHPIFLAPMEDVTDIGFRLLCKRYGASMVYTEFVSAEALVRSIKSTVNKLTISDEERPVGIQIYGRDVDAMVEAAKIVEQAHPDVIDLNFGCPVKKVAGKGAGAGMLQNIPLMLEITEKVVKAVNTPVTVKTRLGWSADNLIITTLAEQLQDCGIQALTIHGRTRAQMYTGEADWSLIGEVKRNPRIHIPIIGNGDITTPEQAAASEPRREQTGPAIPEPGDVVVSFDKINELMAEKRQNARAEVEKAETPEAPEAAAPGETPQPANTEEPKKPRRGRPPKAEKAATENQKSEKSAEARKGRPPKADKAAPDKPKPSKRDKVSRSDGKAPDAKEPIKPAQDTALKETAAVEQTAPEPTTPPRPVEEGKLVYLKLSEVHPFHTFRPHPFKVRDDAKMQEIVASIRVNGVMVPGLARPEKDGNGYEIVAGHRRTHGSELAGLKEMPFIVREMTDHEAVQAMKDSNKQRDGMLPSELAALLELEVEDIKHQGGRLKGVAEGDVGKRSVEIVGEAHEMNYKKVMRYLRLNSLVPELLDKVDDKKMGFMPAVELSYIKPKNQRLIAVSIDGEQASPSLAQAKRLRELDKEGKLNGDVIDGILSEQKKEDRGVIISTAELEKYFGKEVTPAKMKEQIMSLLDDWKEKQPPELAKAPKKQELDK